MTDVITKFCPPSGQRQLLSPFRSKYPSIRELASGSGHSLCASGMIGTRRKAPTAYSDRPRRRQKSNMATHVEHVGGMRWSYLVFTNCWKNVTWFCSPFTSFCR
jgi:hypothetical protein